MAITSPNIMGDKAIRGGLESDVKGKIAQLETPPSESDKGSWDRTSSKKVAFGMPPPAVRRECLFRSPR
jgi:hypothetical protein